MSNKNNYSPQFLLINSCFAIFGTAPWLPVKIVYYYQSSILFRAIYFMIALYYSNIFDMKYALLYTFLWLIIFDILHHYFGDSKQYKYFLLKNKEASELRTNKGMRGSNIEKLFI